MWRFVTSSIPSPSFIWELQHRRRQMQRQRHKLRIWLAEWGNTSVLHVRHALLNNLNNIWGFDVNSAEQKVLNLLSSLKHHFLQSSCSLLRQHCTIWTKNNSLLSVAFFSALPSTLLTLPLAWAPNQKSKTQVAIGYYRRAKILKAADPKRGEIWRCEKITASSALASGWLRI